MKNSTRRKRAGAIALLDEPLADGGCRAGRVFEARRERLNVTRRASKTRPALQNRRQQSARVLRHPADERSLLELDRIDANRGREIAKKSRFQLRDSSFRFENAVHLEIQI